MKCCEKIFEEFVSHWWGYGAVPKYAVALTDILRQVEEGLQSRARDRRDVRNAIREQLGEYDETSNA